MRSANERSEEDEEEWKEVNRKKTIRVSAMIIKVEIELILGKRFVDGFICSFLLHVKTIKLVANEARYLLTY